jgi:D-alanine-D-alanine ligase
MEKYIMSKVLNSINDQLTGNLAVLYGGKSSERPVSLESGQAVFDSLVNQGLDVVQIDTQKVDVIEEITKRGIKHTFISLHGGEGEDGTLQGLLDSMGVTYTGSGVLGSALGMDKMRSKQLWKGIGVSTANFLMLDADTNWSSAIEYLQGRCIVKPSEEGSSIGMKIAESEQELQEAFEIASEYGGSVIAEKWIEGNEYTVSILGDEALPVIMLET